MKDLARRNSLKAGMATMVAAAVAGTARQASAHEAPTTPFAVPQTTIPIQGSQAVFPVRRIYCIGRNYAAHSREMGSDPTREPPFFFQKPTDAIQFVAPGTVGDHPYPSLTKNYHYEVELVAALKSGGKDIPVDRALDHVFGYALGLDMTRRDLQVNGVVKQKATLDQMIWSVAEQISRLSQANELFPGDIIYSGTPENVGPVVRGDVILCKLDRLPDLSIRIT